jgi:hypothetical protein
MGGCVPAESYAEEREERREKKAAFRLGCLQRYPPNPILYILHLQNSLQDSLLYISFLSNNVL